MKVWEPSSRQREAQEQGTEQETVRYFQRAPAMAILVFVSGIVLGAICFEIVVHAAARLFRTSRDLSLEQWILVGLVWLLFLFVIVRLVARVPLTSAFTY